MLGCQNLYSHRIGHSVPVPGLRQAVSGGDTTEQNARIYYDRWKQVMQGLSWDELMAKSRSTGMTEMAS